MSKIKYYIRKHLKKITKIHDVSRNFLYNAKYTFKCRFIKIKNPDTFFFVIDPQRRHPGLADRLKAIVTAYNEAKLNHLRFKIIYKTPFSLEEYLLPTSKENDWIADYNNLEYSWMHTKFVNERRGWHLKAKAGAQYHCYNYTGDILPEIFENTGETWHDLFSELFTPCIELQNAIESTKLKNKTYNAVHLRFVNALENFEGGYYNNLKTEEEKLNLIQRCHKGLSNIIKESKKEGIDKVVVFSDSNRFLESIKSFDVITLDSSSIGHISFNNSHENVLKTFLDFFIISGAKTVYRIGAPEMYLSSCYALCAARAGGATYKSILV